MNLTEFEWIKTELKWIFYEQIKPSGKAVIFRKRISLFIRRKYVSQVEKTYSAEYAKDRGSLLQFLQGLLSKNAAERVTFFLSPWSSIGRPRIAPGKATAGRPAPAHRRGGAP